MTKIKNKYHQSKMESVRQHILSNMWSIQYKTCKQEQFVKYRNIPFAVGRLKTALGSYKNRYSVKDFRPYQALMSVCGSKNMQNKNDQDWTRAVHELEICCAKKMVVEESYKNNEVRTIEVDEGDNVKESCCSQDDCNSEDN